MHHKWKWWKIFFFYLVQLRHTVVLRSQRLSISTMTVEASSQAGDYNGVN